MTSHSVQVSYSIDELKACLRETARLWKRKITPVDVSICEDLFLKYGFDGEMIRYLLAFAKKRGADTLKYLYPIADVLKKRGIRTQTEAELTLEKSFQKYMDILVYINWKKTVPSAAEKEKIDAILEKYAPTAEEIRAVGEITRNAKRPSLRYFETVLKNRRENAAKANAPYTASAAQEESSYRVLHFPEDFEKIKQSVKKEAGLSDMAYNTWIRDLKVARSTEDEIEISVPGHDDRFLHLVEKKYKGYFENAWKSRGVDKQIMLSMES